jgi:iron complex outermembrane receptor protein
MNHLKIKIAFILFMFICAQPSQAQEIGAVIKGMVANTSSEPAPFSTIVLMNKDSVFIKGTLSELDGQYTLDKIDPGTYLVMVLNIEFQNYVSQPIRMEKNATVQMDKIELQTKVTKMDEVTVTAEKAMVEVHPDKMVFNVAKSVNASGNNGMELLAKAPGVIVDLDKNITLQGKSGVRIYINGQPSRLSGSDLTTLLEGMRSEDIESFEIISNPSAKYEAEGTGGIINIKLKKNLKSGFNGSVFATYSLGDLPRKSAGTSLNYRTDKINFNTSLNFSDDEYQDDIIRTALQENYLLDLESYSTSYRKGMNFSGGVDYTINENHNLSLDARLVLTNRDKTLNSKTIISDVTSAVPSEVLKAQVLDTSPSNNTNINLHYSFIPDRNSSLTSDISYGKYYNRKETFQPNEYWDESESNMLRTVLSEYNTSTVIDLLSGQIDYEKKIDQFTLSTGGKYSYIQTQNELEFYKIDSGVPTLDINKSNDFSYLEKIASLYFIFNTKVGARTTINAGIRVENTSSLGELESEIPINDNVVPRNYTSVFPDFSISYDDQKNNVLSASIGRRISRPNYNDLNPFESKLNEISTWKGNPFLKPQYIDNYQLTYSFKRKLVISNTFSVTHDYFANVFIPLDGNASILTPLNMQTVKNNGLSASYSQKVIKWYEFTSFFIYNFESYKGDMEGAKIDLQAHIVNFRLQNNFNLPFDIKLEISYYANSPWIWGGTVNVKGYQTLGAGIKREFFDKNLLVQLTGNDILGTGSDFYFNSNYGGMVIDGVRSFDNQRFGFSATYKFGNTKAKNAKKKKSAIDDELKRIGD